MNVNIASNVKRDLIRVRLGPLFYFRISISVINLQITSAPSGSSKCVHNCVSDS